MKALTTTLISLMVLGLWGTALAQGGAGRPNFHSGNKLRVTFRNDGRLAGGGEITAEWPIATGHEYLDVAYPVVAVTVGGSQQVPAFQPVAAYAAGGDGTVAMSHRPETWPGSWPDRPADWAGQWNGYFGKGRLTADQESIYALEDPSLGLRLVVRGWQWSHYLAQDMLFLHYELQNVGNTTFDEVAVGFFARPLPGGDGDNRLVFDPSRSQVVAIDRDNIGHGRGFARAAGDWSPVGQFAVALLETPGNPTDGIDNDGDGMIDESRFDGIDNDGDWRAFTDLDSSGAWNEGEPLNDDVGADGVAGTGDEGEGDGLPTPGEPNFDATDVDESDQIGLTSLAAFSANGFSAASAGAVWGALTPNRFDAPGGAAEFVLGSGTVPLAPGQSIRFSVVIFCSESDIDQQRNESVVDRIFEDNYRFPVAPPPPEVTAVPQNNAVTLYWDTRAEAWPGFEGYKIYRSTDPGFNDVYTVTDDKGHLIYSEPIATIDMNDGVKGLFPAHAFGFRYFLGKDSGLLHRFTDTDVLNGRTYYYAVVAYTQGELDTLTGRHNYPTESTKSIVVTGRGEIITDVNTRVVVPTVESVGYNPPEYTIEHSQGVSTGEITVEIVDRTRIRDAVYEITFDSVGNQVAYSLRDITDPGQVITWIDSSQNYSAPDALNENDPLVDGFRVYLFNDSLAWDSVNTVWKVGESNWTIRLDVNNNLGPAEPEPVDYEVRFGEMGIDTALFTTPIPVPFQVWNVTENVKENILILDQNGDGEWSSGEPIFVVEGNTLQTFRPVHWTITLSAPEDSTIASVPPQNGDVAFIPTRKPFNVTDVYTLITHRATVDAALDKSVLEQIKVVPNPYVVSSRLEQSPLYTGGEWEHRLQFIHLPQRCTIRIYNLRGFLIDVIEHNSDIDNGTEWWDLRAGPNGKNVAFGMYIYHVDAPGIGEKIGRFAIIR